MRGVSLSPLDPGSTPPWKGGRVLRFLVKVVVSSLLLGWLTSRGSLERVLTSLSSVSIPWFLLAVFTYLCGQTVCAWKWSLLGGLLNFHQPFRFYWMNYLAGMFVSLFLPTTVGGDAYRALTLARENEDRTGAAVSVLADRGTGVLAMAWIASLASFLSPIPLPEQLRLAVHLTCAGLTVGFMLPFLCPRMRWPRWALSGLPGRVLTCWDRPGTLIFSVLLSAAFQGLAVAVYLLLGQSLGLPLGSWFYAVLCPVVSLASMAPLTLNGLGVREWTLAVLFPLAGVKPEAAIAFGLAWAALSTLASLTGGAVLLFAPVGLRARQQTVSLVKARRSMLMDPEEA